jgi:hypothetical protein
MIHLGGKSSRPQGVLLSVSHLHFRMMNGPTIGPDGLPYSIDRFDVVGQIPLESPEAFYQFEGDWSIGCMVQ